MAEFHMPNAGEWLDLLKQERGLETDAECAAYLKVSKQAVSHWRQGRHQLGVGECISLGIAIGVNPLFIILCSQYLSAKPEKQKKWRIMASQVEPKVPQKPGSKRLN